jgi:hypothetical protein
MTCALISRLTSRSMVYGAVTWAVASVLLTAFALEESLTFSLLLTGQGPPAVNWLLFAAAVGSLFATVVGTKVGTRRVLRRELLEQTSAPGEIGRGKEPPRIQAA